MNLDQLPVARLRALHQSIVGGDTPSSRATLIRDLSPYPNRVAQALGTPSTGADSTWHEGSRVPRLDAVEARLHVLDALEGRLNEIDIAQDSLFRTVADKLGPSGPVERAVQTAQAAADAAIANARAISSLEARPAVDPSMVADEISAVVRSILGPVLQDAKDAGRETEVRTALARGDQRPAQDVFGTPAPGTVGCWDHPDAPPVDPSFVWTPEHLRAMQCADHEGMLVWLAGPKGTGKTSIAQQFAARTGRPFTRINFFRHSSSEDYLGSGALSEGSTTWEPGDFLKAYVTPGSLILLDELSTAHPGVLSHLNGLLEPNARVSLGGRVWTRAPGVMIVAADNTNGSGDVTGRYSGTQAANSATVDRFGLMLRVDYLDRATESQALANGARCSLSLAEHVIDAFAAIRAKVDSGDVVDPPSLRQAIAFVRASRWMPVSDAWEASVVTRQPIESAVALRAVFASHIDPSQF